MEGLGLELEEDESFCWRTGWGVSFMEKILKRWTKINDAHQSVLSSKFCPGVKDLLCKHLFGLSKQT